MANIAVANTSADLSGDRLVTAENNDTITGLKTFDRDPSAPFAVSSGSAVVTNLDADMVDGHHGTEFALLTGPTFTGNPVISGSNPGIRFLDTDQGTNLKNIFLTNDGGYLQAQTRNDDLSLIQAIWSVDLNGNEAAIGSINSLSSVNATNALTVTGAAPYVLLSETGVAANTGKWFLYADTSVFSVIAVADNLGAVQTGLSIDRSGNTSFGAAASSPSTITALTLVSTGQTTAGTGVYEHGRGLAMGDSAEDTWNSGNFTVGAGGGSWGVDDADYTGVYRVVGDTMWHSVTITTSSISGTASILRILAPAGVTIQSTTTVPCLVGNNGGALELGLAFTVASTPYISVFLPTGANFTGTNNLSIYYQGFFKVSGF